jgi:hypothetical protein
MSHQEIPQAAALPDASRPQGSRVGRWIRRGLFALLIVAATLPYLLCWTPLRDTALGLAAHRSVHGKMTTGEASFGWFSPPVVRDLEIRSADDPPAVTVGSIEMSQPLWKLIGDPRNIGSVRVESPQVNLVVNQDRTSNLGKIFPPPADSRPPGLTNVAVAVEANNVGFTWQLAGSDHQWSVRGIQLKGALEPAATTESHRAELVLEPGKILDHYDISAPMCDDVLQFAAPILAHAPDVDGQISLQLGGGRLPIEMPRNGQLSGTVTLHSIEVSPGPMARELVRLFNSTGVVRVARESKVDFRLADGRIYHEGLEFGIEPLRVMTRGTVGFDESLDLVAEVHFDPSQSTMEKMPLLSKLNQHVLRFPIRGTLKAPQFDIQSLAENSPALLGDLFSKLKTGESGGLEQTMQKLREGGTLQPSADGQTAEPDLPAAAGALIKGLIDRRRERAQENAQEKN